jgi:hypothetical protein
MVSDGIFANVCGGSREGEREGEEQDGFVIIVILLVDSTIV